MRRALSFTMILAVAGLCLGASKNPKLDKKSKSQSTAGPMQLAGAHILIAYRGATRARPTVTRSRVEAQRLAAKLAKQARAGGATVFARLARSHSDGPSGPKGGDLGSWRRGRMVPAFDAALVKLSVGEVTKAPVETRFGFHVILRKEPPLRLAGAHILVAYKGAKRSRARVTRSKAEARALAGRLNTQARAKPSDFGALAQQHSDCPSAPKGGDLGSWQKGRMVPAFDAAVVKLKVGEVTRSPVETPFGYHVILRKAP